MKRNEIIKLIIRLTPVIIFTCMAVIAIRPKQDAKVIAVTTEEIVSDVTTTYPFKYSYNVPMPNYFIEFTVNTAEKYGINPALVFAVMRQESNFDFLAKSTNCYGIMQIHSINYDELHLMLGVSNLMCPEQNIESGCYILSRLLDKYPLERALVCYNCGEHANNLTSTKYSKQVIEYFNEYNKGE